MPIIKATSGVIQSIAASQIQQSGATAGQVLTYNGSTGVWVASAAPGSSGGALTVGTSVNATGTSVSFTGIPSSANRVTLLLKNVSSTTQVNYWNVQIGSGAYSVSGYTTTYGDMGEEVII